MEQNRQQINRPSMNQLNPVLYFQPDYLNIQQYPQLKEFRSDGCFACFAIDGSIAKSLPKSPFGGIYVSGSSPDFAAFQTRLENELRSIGVQEMMITQPPPYYQHFVTAESLLTAGYHKVISESNQFISISNGLFPRLHLMEKRKLKNKTSFNIRKTSSIREIHRFIAKCRKQNGLEINITEEKLLRLFDVFPERYEIFEARKDGATAAAVIMTLPVNSIAYYYLPATNPEFKALSPMVSLMEYIYHYYHKRNVDYLDLGISSIDGKLQKSLYDFKKRMGAESTSRILLAKRL